jgi:enamine deaminase RidA (YjgF/YER057c/UK114 family)
MTTRVHSLLYPPDDMARAWRAPTRGAGGSRFERLIFVAGQSDVDDRGGVRNPGRLAAQVEGAMDGVFRVIESLGGRAADVAKLVVFHRGTGVEDEDTILRSIRKRVTGDTPPAISLVALPRLSHPDMAVSIKAVGIDNTDGHAPRTIASPAGHWGWPRGGEFSQGLRCGEFAFVSAQSARDKSGRIQDHDDIVAQARLTIDNIARVLDAMGCDLDDVVKLNTWYLGYGTDADWRRAAEVRSNAFRFPGPGATGVPVPQRYPDGALIRQECLALRGTDGQRLPRSLSWPLGHWDWPMRVSFQQGIKVGRLIVLGGQYSMDAKGLAVAANDMSRQVEITLDFIQRILAGFGARMEDLIEVTGFYKHDSIQGRMPLATARLGKPEPPITEVPLGTLGLEGVTLEVEGFAIAPE